MDIAILQYDETEAGPRVRRMLIEKHGIACTLEEADIGGIATDAATFPKVDLYSYRRPSNGQVVWLLEAQIFFPPDVQLYRSWALSARPTAEQAREIVARDIQPENRDDA